MDVGATLARINYVYKFECNWQKMPARIWQTKARYLLKVSQRSVLLHIYFMVLFS
jgi:hypothetical protein